MVSSITMPYMKKSLEDLLLFVKERKAAMSLDPCRLTFEGRSTSSLGRVRSALAGALAVWRSNGAPPSHRGACAATASSAVVSFHFGYTLS
jgi:hypothetical protein